MPCNPEWTKHDSAELASAMAQVLMTHRREIYDWPTLTDRWKAHGYDTLLRKLKIAIRDDLVKKHEGAEMPDGPQKGGAAGSPSKMKRITDREEREDGERSRALVVRKSKGKARHDSLFDGSSDDADSESEEAATPPPRALKTRGATTTPMMTPRPKPRPSATTPSASTSRRTLRQASLEVITIDDSSDEEMSRNHRSKALVPGSHGRHGGYGRQQNNRRDEEVETTSEGDRSDSPGPLLLTPSQGSSPTMDQWRQRALLSNSPSTSSPSSSRAMATKKRPPPAAGSSSGGGSNMPMQSPTARLKRLKLPAPEYGFSRRDYETSPTANRPQRGAAAQAAEKWPQIKKTLLAKESDWDEEEEEDGPQLREEEGDEDHSLVKSASRRSQMLAELFSSDEGGLEV